MAEVQTQTFSLDGLGIYSMCARFLYSGKNGAEVVCDILEQAWMLSLWECAIQCKTIWPSDDIRGAISAIATTNVTARRRAIDSAPAQITSFMLDLDIVKRIYWQDVKVGLTKHLPNIGISREDGRTIITKTMAISANARLAAAITDRILRESTVSGSTIMEGMAREASQTSYPHVAGRPVEGCDDSASDSESELAPWFSALNRIKYYQDKRMTLDEFLHDFGSDVSNTLLPVRENEAGLPHIFDDESYSRMSGSELLVFESARWISFKLRGSVLNFQKTNRAVSSRMGTDIHPPAVSTALPGSSESALTVTQMKEALNKLETHRESEIERLYQLTLAKDAYEDDQEEDVTKEIMLAVQIKRVGDRMGITYCDANKRISTALRNWRMSCVTFNAHMLEDDIEFECPSQDQVEPLASDADYTEFQTASELDAWLEDTMKSRGVLGDRKNLRDMLRGQVEKLIAAKFDKVQVNGSKGYWARLYRFHSVYDERAAEYIADLPHMITSNTTLEADSRGMTQRGVVAVRTAATMWHIKKSRVEPGDAVTGRMELKEGDYVA